MTRLAAAGARPACAPRTGGSPPPPRAGSSCRVLTMLGFPPAIWFGGDSASYLSTALRYVPGTSRLSGYGVLLLVLRPFHSFAVVTAVQHLMGLAIGVLSYALLRRYGLPGWGATLAALPVLFSAYQVQLEQEILPSAAFCCLIMTAAALTLWWRDRRPPQATAAAGGLLAVSACFWPVGLPLLLVFLAYLVLRRAGLAGAGRDRGGGGAAAGRLPGLVRPHLPPGGVQQQRRHLPVVPDDELRQLRGDQAAAQRGGAVPAPGGPARARRPPRYIWAPDSPLDRLPRQEVLRGQELPGHEASRCGRSPRSRSATWPPCCTTSRSRSTGTSRRTPAR